MTEKAVEWVGSSLEDLKAMPGDVVKEFGYVLSRVQNNESHPAIKPWTGEPGVQEIRVNDADSTYRTVYVVNLPDAIYVLHAFKKKSSSGIATPKKDKDIVSARLSKAREQSRAQTKAQEEKKRRSK